MLEKATAQAEPLLVWDTNPPHLEWHYGHQEATRLIKWEITRRSDLLLLLAALEIGRIEFLRVLQTLPVVAKSPAADAPLDVLEAFVFGACSGGLFGEYANGYLTAFEELRSCASSVH